MRNPDDLALETEYWRGLLDDVEAISGGIRDGADTLMEAMTPLLALVARGNTDESATILRVVNDTLMHYNTMQEALARVTALADGRSKVLRAELEAMQA